MSICISDDPLIERDIKQNFLCPECEADGYKLRMLESNRIPGLLQLKVTEEDGRKHLLYDISSRESLNTVLATRVLTGDQVESFVYGMNRILLSIEAYLLDAGDLVMKPEYIYVSEDFEPTLCCVPDYCGDFAAALSDILRGILGSVDQRDHGAVVMAYRLYQKTMEPHYVMQDLINILERGEHGDERAGIVSAEKPAARHVAIAPGPAAEQSGKISLSASSSEKDVPDNDELFELMSADPGRSRKKKKRFFRL